ncbi:hypothetical protein K469DRAFT_706598 [Zopfia rhizophila CBS 207.26]|uniref:Uncharacterized protein n=1 Tax=Zopfia rhizophila CBS 207.26 TaxID=1314779 RepID=A0A6A6E3Y6_9PEZI|nr:hypothetical protein K469DRAFT_706598 [Zopfia rhizophila CBS 207.26]
MAGASRPLRPQRAKKPTQPFESPLPLRKTSTARSKAGNTRKASGRRPAAVTGRNETPIESTSTTPAAIVIKEVPPSSPPVGTLLRQLPSLIAPASLHAVVENPMPTGGSSFT